MKKFFLYALRITHCALLIAFLTATAHAEIKTYSGVGEYLLTRETVDFAKRQAELSAERDALEQVSVYVKARSTMLDNELDADEVITISTGILRVTDTKFSIEDDAAGLLVKAFVTAEIDTDELETLLEQEIKNRTTKK